MIIKKYQNGQQVGNKLPLPQKKYIGTQNTQIKKSPVQTDKPVKVKRKKGGCGCGKKKP